MRDTPEGRLQRQIICERSAEVVGGELVARCDGDCLAHLLGWRGLYVTPLRTRHGWQTPTRGDLGVGWVDLVLVRPGRVIAAELKGPTGRVTPEQAGVMRILEDAGLEVHVWRPADLDSGAIERTLRRR